jgi:hypothetical protein
MATAGDRAVWLRRGATDLVWGAPDELGDGEFLRSHVSPGRIVGLLPLIHFLREVTAESAWTPPAGRASFVVDDPNLHWRSYGHIDYRGLARHAREHAYHIVMAMVPIDSWFADPRAARLFRENRDVLSLCFHGNDHRKHDLEQPRSHEAAVAVLSSAVRRIERFERRYGIGVSRVMVPPHEACSAATIGAMAELGFEAACTTRPYLWVDFGTPPSPYNAPSVDHLLSGWRMTELMENGFPVVLRREFRELDDALLRRYFDQPIVLYGHAEDFAEGLGLLERAAATVNSFPDVTWMSLADLAATNFESRREGATLRVRPLARRVRVEVDPGVQELALEPPDWVGGFDHGVDASIDGRPVQTDDAVVRLPTDRDAAGVVEIRWRPVREVTPGSVPSLPFNGGVLLRRLVSEARDRVAPLRR